MIESKKPLVVTIDGKSGVGKSELSEKLTRTIPEKLGLSCAHFDTGLFFRAAACSLAIDNKKIDLMSPSEISEYLSSRPFSLQYVKNEDTGISKIVFYKENEGRRFELDECMLKSDDVGFMASQLGGNEVVVRWMEDERKKYVEGSSLDVVVVNGRDTAANYFPRADLKIILTEEESARARRRALEKIFSGEENVDTDRVRSALLLRDEKDADLLRSNSSLSGVWEIDRTGLSSKMLSELVAQALGVMAGSSVDFALKESSDFNHCSWIFVKSEDGRNGLTAESNLNLRDAFQNPVLAFALLGISNLFRIKQKHIGGNLMETKLFFKNLK